MIAGSLIGQFVESADEIFEDQPHLLVGHLVGMQIYIAELGDHEIKDICLTHLLDLVLELEISKIVRTFAEKPLI